MAYGTTGSVVAGQRNRGGGRPHGGLPTNPFQTGNNINVGMGNPRGDPRGMRAGQDRYQWYGNRSRGANPWDQQYNQYGRRMTPGAPMDPNNFTNTNYLQDYLNQNAARRDEWQGLRDQAMGGYTQLQNAVRGEGKQELADVNEQFNSLRSRSHQDLVNRGLGSSIMLQGNRAGVERRRSDAAGGVRDRIGRRANDIENQRLMAQERFDTLGFQYGREDDLNQIQLAMDVDTAGMQQNFGNIADLIQSGVEAGYFQINSEQDFLNLINSIMSGVQQNPRPGFLTPAVTHLNANDPVRTEMV